VLAVDIEFKRARSKDRGWFGVAHCAQRDMRYRSFIKGRRMAMQRRKVSVVTSLLSLGLPELPIAIQARATAMPVRCHMHRLLFLRFCRKTGQIPPW